MDVEGKNFNDQITSYLSKAGIKNNQSSKCLIKISSRNDIKDSPLLIPYAWVSMLTLMIVPYYVPLDYEAKATLISYPQDSQIHGTIKTSIREAKPGDIFLNENNQPTKLLKEYYLKDKVHEYWSLLAEIGFWIVAPTGALKNSTISTPEDAKQKTENTISEALVRQVIHDASTFEECRKNKHNSSLTELKLVN